MTEGHLLGGYTFTRHKSSPDPDTGPSDVVVLSSVGRRKEVVAAFERAQVVAAAVATTRDWVNEPPGHLTPELFAAAASEAHKAVGKGRGAPKVKLEVLNDDQAAYLMGMHFISRGLQTVILVTYNDPLGHVIADGFTAWIPPKCQSADNNVAVGNDAFNSFRGDSDRKNAASGFLHAQGRVRQCLIRLNNNCVTGHQVFNF